MSRANHRSIDFAIRFKRGAGTQQSYPAQVVERLTLIPGLLHQEHREMRVQQGSSSRGTFEKSPDANKMPALAVAHRRIGYALKEIYFFLHTVEEFMRLRKPHLFHASSLYLQEEAGDLVAHSIADRLRRPAPTFSRRRAPRRNERRAGLGERTG